MNYNQAIQFLYELGLFGSRFGLDVTRRLAALAGNPHERLRFIHVAGTNGKGSTCAMLESIYRHAGLRVGLFTSPHLVSFAERIQVNRQLITQADIERRVAEMEPLVKLFPWEQRPTFFEAVSVMALRQFAEQNCELVIWETGLGGRLDATNIVTPLATVITTIDFDHQQWLGDTLDKIAAEKGGVIKTGVPVITGAQPGRGLEVIARIADQKMAPLTVVTGDDARSGLVGALPLPLRGEHQRFNAALALTAVNAVGATIPVTEVAVRNGLSGVSWPGRLQWAKTSTGQAVILDGAHNAAGAAALRHALAEESLELHPTLVLGVLADKDWETIASTLAPLARRILLAPVNSPRTLPPAQLAAPCRNANVTVEPEVCPSLEAALQRAAAEPLLLITGSLYLVGEAMERLHLSPTPPADERALNEWGGTPAGR